MTGTCALCDLDLPADPVTAPDADGRFCCRGCLAVSRTLDGVEAADAAGPSAPDRSSSAAVPDDADVTYLAVDGMHCSACERFLEAVATDRAGVHDAAANYATDTMRVVHDADRVGTEATADLVSTAGYEATARSAAVDHAVDRSPDADETATRLLVGGFFGLLTMMTYALFVYPAHLGFGPVVEFGPFARRYLLGQVWLFASVVLLYTGAPLLRGAYVSLRVGRPNMDLLVSTAAASAYLYSTVVAVAGGMDVYFDVTVAVVLAVTAGTRYETRVKSSAVSLLADLTGDPLVEARTRDGETVAVEDVVPGTELLVRPGERVPLDGAVVDGVAAVDEALVTGESLPVTKRPGDEVVGGAVVTDAPLVVEVGSEATSTLDRIVGLLWEVRSARGGVQRLADALATVLVPIVVLLAGVSATATLVVDGGVTDALLVGLTVLVVTCPCALGLATPLAVAAGVRAAAEAGVVPVSEAVFETLPETDVVALDKTGTLTAGEMSVTDVEAVAPAALLARAAALERHADHPVADAVVAAAGERATDGGSRPEAPTTTVAPDRLAADVASVDVEPTGVAGRVDGDRTLVGHPDLFDRRGWRVDDRYRDRASTAAATGKVPVLVGWGGRCRGLVVVADRPRETWAETVDRLAGADREVVVLTGDDGAGVERFEAHPAIDEVFAGLPPDGKVAAVRRLRARGRVAMVGDGANDAPALGAADVGIALARGSTLATEAADAVVTTGRLDAVPRLFAVATSVRRRVRENLAWAFGYNAVAVPLAVAGALNPLLAAVAMATSSALVALNSTRGLGPDE